MLPSRHETRARRILTALATTLLFGALGFTSLQAQTWEHLYGVGANSVDGGRRGTIPVTNDACGNANGYITSGYSNVAGNNDVYIVRTDCNGLALWEFTYDVTALGHDDVGRSIAPVLNSQGRIASYVITGFVRYTAAGGNGTSDAFIISIDCNGNLLWSNTYGHPTRDEGGHDIIVTRSGDPTCGPVPVSRGDLAVAGWAREPAGGNPPRLTDGYLFRTTAGGGLIWDAAYDNPNTAGQPTDDIFMALTEVRQMPAPAGGFTPTGDLVAVGITMNPVTAVPARGYVVRASGCNGTIGAAPQGAATYGSTAGVNGFFSVIELRNPAEIGWTGAVDPAGAAINRPNVVVVGEYNNAQDIYLVKLRGGNPTTPLIEQTIGITNHIEYGRDIKEITSSTVGQPTPFAQFDLVLTGAHDDPATADPLEAIALAVRPNFTPIFGSAFNANSGTGRETGWSLFPDNATNCTYGFIMCGTSTSDPLGVGDPEDKYLVKMNGFLRTNCSVPYNPARVPVNTRITVAPKIVRINQWQAHHILSVARNLNRQVCAFGAKSSPTTGEDLSFESTLDVSAAPNPVTHGQPLTVQVKAEESAPMSLTLSNSLGEIVKTVENITIDGTGNVTVATDGLPAGVYNATLRGKSDRVTVRVVVVE